MLAQRDNRVLVPLAVVGATTLAVAVLRLVRAFAQRGALELIRNILGTATATARAFVPGAAAALDAAAEEALIALRDEIAPPVTGAIATLPAMGIAAESVLSILQSALDGEAATSGIASGAAFGGIYHVLSGGGTPQTRLATERHSLLAAVAATMLDSNQLYPGLFRTARRVEAEAVACTVALLRGGALAAAPAACGVLTSGGTESILLAVKAYRDAALERLGYTQKASGSPPPVSAAARDGLILTVIAGTSAHPALDKAGELFGLRILRLPVDPVTLALSPRDVSVACDRDTLLVYASAPGFPHGVVDDIPAIAATAAAFVGSVAWGAAGVPLHVDNCLGGVLLSFQLAAQETEAAGGRRRSLSPQRPIPRFDLRVPNVATISVDLHKYGGAPKGASVLVFRNPELRRAAYFTSPDFPGGVYATPTLGGSRSGAPGALAWATLLHTGAKGYAHTAARVGALHARLCVAIAATPGVVLLGEPHACIVPFTAASGASWAPYSLAARMAAQPAKWKVPLLQRPAGCALCVTERLLEPSPRSGVGEWSGGIAVGLAVGVAESWCVADQWVEDMRSSAVACATDPGNRNFRGKGEAGIYGAALVLPPMELARVLQRYCDVLYVVRPAVGESGKRT